MIERGVYQLLASDPAVMSFVDDRVFVDVAEDATGDYLVVTGVAGGRPLYVDGTAKKQRKSLVQIDVYAADPENVRELAEAVINLFHGKPAQADGHDIQHALLRGDPDSDFEPDAKVRRVMLEFDFFYH